MAIRLGSKVRVARPQGIVWYRQQFNRTAAAVLYVIIVEGDLAYVSYRRRGKTKGAQLLARALACVRKHSLELVA